MEMIRLLTTIQGSNMKELVIHDCTIISSGRLMSADQEDEDSLTSAEQQWANNYTLKTFKFYKNQIEDLGD